MNFPKVALYGLTTILIATGSFFFFKSFKKPEPLLYETAQPVKNSVTQYIQASGTLEAEDSIIVGSLIPGRVIELFVDENDFVKKGDKLVILDDGIDMDNIKKTTAVLEQRKAELTFEEKQFKREEALYKSDNLSEEKFDTALKRLDVAKALAAQAEADLLIAQHDYENRTIHAPTDGVIIARNIELGQMVTSVLDATKLFLIAQDLKKMVAKVDIDEADVGKVNSGSEVSFYVDAFPTKEFSSKIKRVNYQSKIVNSVISYVAEVFVDNPDQILRPGMTVNVDIQVAKNENVLTVPLKALRVADNAIAQMAEKYGMQHRPLAEKETRGLVNSLWTLKDNTFIEKKVTLGAQNRSVAAILDGLTEQDVIVTAINQNSANPLVTNITKGKIGG